MKLLLLVLFLFPFTINAQNLYFPPTTSTDWDTINPSSLNYCSDNIDSLYNYLETNNSKAFILLKDGKIVLEKYFGTFTEDSLWYWASAGKTLMAVLVGLAQEDGFLSINDRTTDYLGQGWTDCSPAQEDSITIWHQLTMTSGLDDGVPNVDCTIDTCLQYLSSVGTRWAYHNAPYTLLAEVLENATGMSQNAYYFNRLRNPIGMTGVYAPTGFNNVYYSDARSMARFGLFLLADGKWDGATIMADTNYLEALRTPSQSLNNSYGYLTWLNGQSSFMLPQLQFEFNGSINPNAPSDMYAAMGKNGQVINVVPSQNLVWIRMGDAPPSGSGLIAASFNDETWAYINNLACTTTSIDINSTPNIQVYPNPVSNMLYITSIEPIESINLYNIQGQLVDNLDINDNNPSISLKHLNNGLYILRIKLKNGHLHQEKIIKY